MVDDNEGWTFWMMGKHSGYLHGIILGNHQLMIFHSPYLWMVMMAANDRSDPLNQVHDSVCYMQRNIQVSTYQGKPVVLRATTAAIMILRGHSGGDGREHQSARTALTGHHYIEGPIILMGRNIFTDQDNLNQPCKYSKAPRISGPTKEALWDSKGMQRALRIREDHNLVMILYNNHEAPKQIKG